MSDTTIHDGVAPAWSGRVHANLFWRKDAFGDEGRDLYVNGLYIGCIMHVPILYGTDVRPHGKPWRALLMSDDTGRQIGWFATEQETKDALIDAALKELAV